MRKKRIGEWLLVATMCAALAVSCGKKDDSDDVSNQPTNQAENPSDVTPEATPEMTPEATPEATPEVTPEATPEVTPEETSQPEDKTGEEDGDISNVQLYRYGWNGAGVDFGKADIRGWNDNDVESPLTDESGNSLYHTEENFGSDMYLVFDFGEAKEIGTIRMATPNENILADSWAVYAGNQMNNAASSWEVLAVSSDMQLADGVIEVAANGTYQYVMIGGYNPDDFMNAWVHAWDYMTEISFVEGAANQEQGTSQEETSNVQVYEYGWNGSGVDFMKSDIRGWNDNDTAALITDASGNALNDDRFLIFDFGEGKTIGSIRMETANENILEGSWAVYAGNQMNNAASSWEVLMVSSEMQLADGVIEVPVNGTYQYVMIGGHNTDDFMNAWVHTWDGMTEISFVEGGANQEQGTSQEETSNLQVYEYGWNGSGVDFMKSDIRGWNDNDTASLITDASGNSLNDDRFLIFDFGEGKTIGSIRMETANENILEGSWAVYAGNQMNNAASSWEVLMLSSEMQLADGVIEVPVNGTYQYVMIGGHNADDFMNAWVHTWDGMTEISFVE